MKKLISLLLAALLLFSLTAAGAEDSESISFQPELTSTMDNSVSEWTESESNRALFSVLLVLDAAFDSNAGGNDILYILSHDTYVLRYSNWLSIAGYTDDYLYYMTYAPQLKTAQYGRIRNESGSLAGTVIEATVKQQDCEAYYKNDSAVVLEWLQTISDLVKDQ